MSCYVDPLFVMEARNKRVWRLGEKHGHHWCHLWADTLEELHAMAKKIGMKPEWFQNDGRLPHYDLVPPRRAEAVRLGAIEWALADWYRGKRPAPTGQMELGQIYLQQYFTADQIRQAIEHPQVEEAVL